MSVELSVPAGIDSRWAKTAAGLAEAFAHRIAAGLYEKDDLLPSCREIARELEMDKNTVNKAYGILERKGLVRAVPGRGVMVLDHSRAESYEAGLRENLRALVWQARAAGIAEDQLWRWLVETVGHFYTLTQVRVAFIECNEHDATHMAGELRERINLPITTILLHDFLAAPRRYLAEYDLLASTFNHFAAIQRVAGASQHKLIGLHAVAVMDDMLGIVSMRAGTRVGVVCTAEGTISTLTNLLKTYNAEVTTYPCLAMDQAELERTIAQVDVIIDTETSHPLVMRLSPGVPTITAGFGMEEHSVQMLFDKVAELTRERVRQLA